MPRRFSACLIFAFLVAAPPATSQDVGKDWLIEPLEWTKKVEGLERVSIVNRFGSVRIGGTSGTLAESAEIYAMVQHHVDDSRRPEIVSTYDQGALVLEVAYPGDAEVASPPDAWRKRRIDITVYVSAAARLRAETLHGSLQVKGFAGPLVAVSESGDLEIKTTGPVTATSKYGKIDAYFTGETLAHPLELETVTGAILLTLPWQAQPRALIETRGEISSDYSIAIEWALGSTLKRGTVAADLDGEPVALRSNRGNIRLLRQIEPVPATLPEPTSAASTERIP